MDNRTLSTDNKNKKIEGSDLPNANNFARAKTSLKAAKSLRQQHHYGFYDSYNDWKQKTEEDTIQDEAEREARERDLQDQDTAVNQMWLRRYAESVLPMCPKPIIEFKEPENLEPKKMTCIHGNTFVVGTTPSCQICQISNNLNLQLDLSEQTIATVVKKVSGGGRNFRYNVWCTERKLGHPSDVQNTQDNNNKVKIIETVFSFQFP